MRLPTRKSERLKINNDDGPLYLTPAGLQKLKNDLLHIKSTVLPQAIEDVKTTAEHGDFSENAEYQEAKARMRHLHSKVIKLEDQIKRAEVIEQTRTNFVHLGSTVTLESNSAQTAFQIVGHHEANPSQGRISNMSPLGSVLMGKTIGDNVSVQTKTGQMSYKIIRIN